MNNENPLSPKDSLLEQKNTGRARVKLVVFFVLAVHCVGLLAFLMAGCKKEQAQEPVPTMDSAATDVAPTNAEPYFEPYTNATDDHALADTNVPGGAPAPNSNLGALPTPGMSLPAPGEPAAPALGATTEYTISKGDNFSTIAKKFGVSVRAITEANPNVVPTKLQIGKKIQVPAPSAAVPAPAPGMDATVAAPAHTAANAGASSATYTVKSGDTLSTIAGRNKVTVKALRSANNLKTDRIKVGQKLKIPGKAAASAPPSEAPGLPAAPAPAL